MRRTKAWWAHLTKTERSELVSLERAYIRSRKSKYISDDCVECGYCGCPHPGYGLCSPCWNRKVELVAKANRAEFKAQAIVN